MCFTFGFVGVFFSRIRSGEQVMANVLSRITHHTMAFQMGFDEFRHLFHDHHHGDQHDGFCSCQMGKEDERNSTSLSQKSYPFVA